MNLTLIKNFFVTTNDKRHFEPTTKIGRVLRRSFRMRRPNRHLVENNRDKRKSGKKIYSRLYCDSSETHMQSSSGKEDYFEIHSQFFSQ